MKLHPTLALAAFALMSTPAFAHVGHVAAGLGSGSAFAAGLAHPLTGADHLLAMAAVGVWAGLCGGKARWVWPLAFVMSMIAGGALGMAGFALPMVEQGILASVLALGLALSLGLKAPLSLGAGLIALAGLCHGFAHGAEAPMSGGAFYVAGFVLATALLHVAGLSLANSPRLARFAGLATLAGGAILGLGASL